MQFRDKEYYDASLERVRQAESLFAEGDAYALAIYCGGLAVECLLRAFRWSEDQTFEGRHNLEGLLRASGMLRVNEDLLRKRGKSDEFIHDSMQELRAATNLIFTLWHNNLRFASEARLKSYLLQTGKVRREKGNPLKRNAREFINAAQLIVGRGMMLWDSQKKS